MKRQLAVAAVSLLLLTGCGTNSNAVDGNQIGFVAADGSAVLLDPVKRDQAVELTAKPVEGGADWQLSAQLGKVVLLNAWGPWCAPCRKEVPELQKLQQEFASKGLTVVGLATRTSRASVAAFVSENGIDYLQLADYDSRALSMIGGIPSATIPSTILIDRKGRVAGWALGAADPALLSGFIESLLEEQD